MTFIIENGAVIGLVLGAVICGVIALVAIVNFNKEEKLIEEILESLDEDSKAELKKQSYEPTKNKSLFSCNAYIGNLKEKGSKVIANLLFYNEIHDQYYVYEVKIPKKIADSKGAATGKSIPVLVSYDKSMQMYNYKKIIK